LLLFVFALFHAMAPERKHAAASASRRRASVADSATLEEQCHQKKIFVGGLGHNTATQHLRDYFAKYGDVADAVVLRWPDGRSRGFGYVTFTQVSAANAALKHAHKVHGRNVDVKRAVPGTNKLFVGGLPQNTTAKELRQHFERYGVVSDAVVMMDPTTNRSRGFGFVCFSSGQDGADALAFALEDYNNHCIRGKWIEVKSAAPPHKLSTEAQASKAAGAEEALPQPAGLANPPAVLDAPPGLEAPAPVMEQSWWAQATPVSMPWPAMGYADPWTSLTVPTAASLEGLPSLLATGRNFHGKFASNASKWSPAKVNLGPSAAAPPLARPAAASGLVFDGGDDLRRSLEQLLKLQALQTSAALQEDGALPAYAAGFPDFEVPMKVEC